DGSAVANSGKSVGTEVVYNNITLYVSKPDESIRKARTGAAVLYLTDVFGIQLLENRLLADSFARAGYLVVAPDLFNGAPAPNDLNTPGFDTGAFLGLHGPAATDPIIAAAVAYVQATADGTAKAPVRIGATGYCFGGRYAFRTAAAGRGAVAAFAAHPSLLEDGEILGVKGPASVAAAENDSMMPPARRAAIEALLLNSTQPYQVALYSGTSHGFGVRANVSNPIEKFAKESAYLQAVRWFDNFL
ncbi:dienelactone hydrolase, partial [Lasiosphaeria miniovina]